MARRMTPSRANWPTRGSALARFPGSRRATVEDTGGSSLPCHHDEVVNLDVPRQNPFAGKWIVTETGDLGSEEMITAQTENQLRRAQKFAPIVSATRQPAE